MVTKTIRGKKYELDDYFVTSAEAKARAKNLEGRLHIFTGAITRTQVSKLSGEHPIWAVWIRKEPNKGRK